MDQVTVRIASRFPLLMQADTLANPLSPVTKAHKVVSSKRKKTDEDYEWLMRSEWEASLYICDDIGPYLPGQNIEAAIAEAGKIRRLGRALKQATLVQEDRCKLEYDGPRKPEAMWKNGSFSDVRAVRVSTARVMRCRPIFLRWAAEFSVSFMPDVIDKATLLEVIEDAGRRVGIGTYRPRFGRFEVESVQ